MEIKPYMMELPFPDNGTPTKELGWRDKNGNTLALYIGSDGHNSYEDGILEWWVVGEGENDKPLQPHQESEVKGFLNEYLKYHGVPEYEIIWRNDDYDPDYPVQCFITLNPLPAAEEKLWKSIWDNKSGNKSCSHENLSIKTMEVLNGELLLTLDCDKCGKRTSTSASLNQGWEAEDLNTWAKQELSSHGQNVSFKNWAKKEVKSHGNIDLVDWAKHEKQSHTKKYGAEYENIGTMQSSPASGYNGYMNMMSSARRLVEIGNETGLDQKLGEAYQDESGRWFLPILERKASESFSLDSKKADSINMEEPVIEEPSFIPDGDGRAIGQQNSSINLSPLHAETYLDKYRSKCRSAIVALHEALYDVVDGKPMTEADIEGLEASHPIIVDAVMRGSNAESFNAEAIGNEIGCDKCGRFAKLWSYANFDLDLCAICSKKEGFRAEGDSATYSPSDEPDMVNSIQTEPTNSNFSAEGKMKGTTSSGQTFYTTGENVGNYGGSASSGEIAFYQGLPELKRTLSTLSSLDDTNRGIVVGFVKEWQDGSTKNLWDACQDMWAGARGKRHFTNETPNWKRAEGDSATYSPSSNPDMVNEIQTSPTNESPQLFNASNTFKTTTALGIGGLVVAALSLPMLYSSAKSRLGKSAEEKRKASGSVRKNHTQVKNSEYSVGQVNPVEAEGQQDIHGAEGITNPRHIPSPTPSGYPSKNLKMW